MSPLTRLRRAAAWVIQPRVLAAGAMLALAGLLVMHGLRENHPASPADAISENRLAASFQALGAVGVSDSAGLSSAADSRFPSGSESASRGLRVPEQNSRVLANSSPDTSDTIQRPADRIAAGPLFADPLTDAAGGESAAGPSGTVPAIQVAQFQLPAATDGPRTGAGTGGGGSERLSLPAGQPGSRHSTTGSRATVPGSPPVVWFTGRIE